MMAQDKVEASVGADLVSGYILRGQNLGGVSVQPSLGISYKGLSLGAWGCTVHLLYSSAQNTIVFYR